MTIINSNSITQIVDVIAAATRLPASLITPNADLEDELGIDSVKAGDIVARLAEEFSLSSEQSKPLASCRSVEALAAEVDSILGRVSSANGISTSNGISHSNGVGVALQSTSRVRIDNLRKVIARVTRLPESLITDSADFEDDLGIDSVMLGRIWAEYNAAHPTSPLPEKTSARNMQALTQSEHIAMALVTSELSHPNSENMTVANDAMQIGSRDKFLEGKVALVSGSGRGLGREVAIYLAKLGARVVVNSFHSREAGEKVVEEIVSSGGEAIHAWGSFAQHDHIDRIVGEAESAFGGLDILIHNASNGRFAKLAEAEDTDLAKAWNTNVMGLHWSAQAASRSMRQRGGGRIIAISATYAHHHMDYFGILGPAKVAMENMVGFLAKELRDDNIQVNALVAGAIDGEVMTHYPDNKRIVGLTEAASQGGRRCSEDELAAFIGLLLRPEAQIITGARLVADRGMLIA